jgi:hypothetical protein
MCVKEHLAYRCGHRSVSVVRPCPMTTAQYDYGVCSVQPSLSHRAETMCPSCERQIHTRWVLIREWEHRWLHERGACGCDVVFPGLIGPRVARPYNGDFPPERMDSSYIPPLVEFKETPGIGRHVDLRLPSVFGVEWTADHRARHEQGLCNCQARFQPYQPEVPESSLSPEEREYLHQARAFEMLNPETNLGEIVSGRRVLQIEDLAERIQNAGVGSGSEAPTPNLSAGNSSVGSDPLTRPNTQDGPSFHGLPGAELKGKAVAVTYNMNNVAPLTAWQTAPGSRTAFVPQQGPRQVTVVPSPMPLNAPDWMGPPPSSAWNFPSGTEEVAPETSGPAYQIRNGHVDPKSVANQLAPMPFFGQSQPGFAGFPLGAGPECASHARPFQMCNLRRPNRRNSFTT